MKIREKCQEVAGDEELLFMDDYDDCIVGVVERCGSQAFVLYDQEKVLRKLRKQGMSHEEAREYHDFNQLGAWVGETTPAFLRRVRA